MNGDGLGGVALGLTLAVLLVRPKPRHQLLLLGASASLCLLRAALEGRWSLLAWQLGAAAVVLGMASWASRSE
ncbi:MULTISPECIES: hypothetical protein [unclassified Hydrogenophaga]|uniref:hypothetical protein n=1 Tax=unclassified Hydrogenophaga TaxID=2610897 RepID=UPI00257CE723|nr:MULTISPECIES: hypothetical protein [unclassified Hydrogenophaga]